MSCHASLEAYQAFLCAVACRGSPQGPRLAPLFLPRQLTRGCEPGGVLRRWLNKSGTYRPPRSSAAGAGLPFELMWLLLEPREVLDAIDRLGTFGKAAQELHRVPSAVSYAVRMLEQELGVEVFERLGNRTRLLADAYGEAGGFSSEVSCE